MWFEKKKLLWFWYQITSTKHSIWLIINSVNDHYALACVLRLFSNRQDFCRILIRRFCRVANNIHSLNLCRSFQVPVHIVFCVSIRWISKILFFILYFNYIMVSISTIRKRIQRSIRCTIQVFLEIFTEQSISFVNRIQLFISNVEQFCIAFLEIFCNGR